MEKSNQKNQKKRLVNGIAKTMEPKKVSSKNTAFKSGRKQNTAPQISVNRNDHRMNILKS